MSIFAEEFQEMQAAVAAENAAKVTDAQIVAEVVENRTEYTKEFKLDNGLFTAAVYSNPVHFLQNGQWADIDNTLKASTDGAFTNTAGVWDVLLPQQLTQGNPISIIKDGYTLSFNMAGELRQQGNLEVASIESEIQNTTLDAATAETTSTEETMVESATEATEAVTEPEETTPETEPTPTEAPTTEPTVAETEPEETVPETQPEETIPETLPPETEPIPTDSPTTEPTVPQETVALIPSEETTTVSINGVAQTFAVKSAQATVGRIQSIDLTEEKESAEHEEFILEKNAAQLMYTNVYQNTNIQYDLQGNTVKESIILNSYNSALRGYRYTLNVGEMIPVLNDDGSIHFYDKNREQIVMVMDAPFLVDEADAISTDVQVSLTGSGSAYTLVYVLPTAWLASSQRAWPVVLDPVISADVALSNIQDHNVAQNHTYNPNFAILECGYGPSYHLQRFYIKYVEIPTLTSSDVVLSAKVRLYKAENSGTRTSVVEVHKVNETWDEDTLTWNNQPEINSTVEDFNIAGQTGFYTWDVTDIVRGWYQGENTGMVFQVDAAAEASTNSSWQQFYASEYGSASYRPNLSITFRNNNGLEDYWDYTSSSAGRAGTGYVNSYTGNLVWVREDIGFGGNRMPVTINHVYNLNDSANNNFGLGYGWRTNFNQRVYQWSQNSSYYVWEDADGTDHYFKYYSSSTYKDEDGLELTLKTNGSGTQKYSITDKTGYVRYFDTNGRLTSEKNNQKVPSSITVTYTTASGLLIDAVTDGAGRTYDFIYANGLLDKISYLGTGTTAVASIFFRYTGNHMTRIANRDGKSTHYAYTGNALTSVKDIDGYKLEYSYYIPSEPFQPYRVESITEYYYPDDSTSTLGGTLNIEYAHNQTTFTDHNGNVEIMQFNDFGNTVSIQDNEGHAQHSHYAINSASESGSANQLRLSSKLQNTVGSRLQDGGFEAGDIWSAISSSITVTRTEEAKYMGSHGLKIYNSSESATETGINRGTIYAAPGSSYTFSAYVKTGNVPAQLAIYDGTALHRSVQLAASTGWTRLETSYTNTTSQTVGLSFRLLTQGTGAIYMDSAQVELSPTASRYNRIVNGDFRNNTATPMGWTRGSGLTSEDLCSSIASAAPQLDWNTFYITGSPTAQKRLTQTVAGSGVAGDTYVLAGWAKGDSAPLKDDRQFGIIGTFNYTDGTTKSFTAQFNPDTDSSVNWQYAAEVMVAEKAYSHITVELAYDYNVNSVRFDGIQLYKEQFGNSYTYDADGNVESVIDLQKKNTTYEYQNNNLTQIIENGKAKMTYTYDDWHNVKTATTDEEITYTFTYDDWGNNTSVSIVNGTNKITTSATYANSGNTLATTTDALGKVTTYTYDANTGLLQSVKYPRDSEDTKTNYTYDAMYRMATTAANANMGSNLSAEYTYSGDLLTQIKTGSTDYNFTYDKFGLRSTVSLGTANLATYTYTDYKNKDLKKLAYRNGDSVQYTYDTKGRVLSQTYEDGKGILYSYDNDGNLATATDTDTGITTTYFYDFIGRVRRTEEKGTNFDRTILYIYDANNNMTALEETTNGVWNRYSYSYDEDNRLNKVTNFNVSTSYGYDNFGRLENRITKHANVEDPIVTENFSYNGNSTQVESMTSTAAGRDVTYSYTYDNNGNIASVSDGNTTTTYYYDTANQLIRENNEAGGYTHTWRYDDAGNVILRREYAYTTANSGTVLKEVNYHYDNANWGDLMTSVSGYEMVDNVRQDFQYNITFDLIANTLSDGTRTYTWDHGRRLRTVTKGGTTWTCSYDTDGLRTKRASGSLTYTYRYSGDQLRQMWVGSNSMTFVYNAEGPIAVNFNGTTYYYTRNLQGDITGLVDANGNSVVEYTYDAWGNPVNPANTVDSDGITGVSGSLANSLGKYNPFRYRGYLYDQETNLYYLQSRYYNPEIGRFINADGLASTGQGLLGNNMFAYCGNNPISRIDSTGESFAVILGLNFNIFGWGMICSINLVSTRENFGVQYSYYFSDDAEISSKKNQTIGVDVGGYVGAQYTEKNDMRELEGFSKSIGGDLASGVDVLLEENGNYLGWQFGATSISYNMHSLHTKTKTLFSIPTLKWVDRLVNWLLGD